MSLAESVWSSSSTSDESSSDETTIIAALACSAVQLQENIDHAMEASSTPQWGGSRLGRSKFRSRKRLKGAVDIDMSIPAGTTFAD